jgi:RNA polymerase sigma-70 factor (TIGR02943 family)
MSQTEAKEKVTSWVTEHSDYLFGYAMKRIGHEEIAKDLIQNTYIAALKSYERFEGRSSPKTWLVSILKNKIMDHFRKESRTESTFTGIESYFDSDGNWLADKLPTSWEEEGHLLDNEDFIEVFKRCLSYLPEKWMGAIQVKYLNPELKGDISHLDISRANYWKILERARLQLRSCIQQNWFVS